MTIAQKIQRFMDDRGLSLTEFADLSSIPKSNLSDLLNGNRRLTLPVLRRAARAMGTTMDYLDDDAQDWPPPKENREVRLTAADWKLLEVARDLCKGDPDLGLAMDRLYLRGYRPGEQFQPPPGESYAEGKAAPPAPRKPGRNSG